MMQPDLNLIRQIMRDVEALQHQFGSAQNQPLPRGMIPAKAEPKPERRQDRRTATAITEALQMKTAFGAGAARRLLQGRGIAANLAERALGGRRDRRQVPDRRTAARAAASPAL